MTRTCLALLGALFVFSAYANTEHKPPGYAIASASREATRAGMDILAKGGNAFDAAVTVSSVLGVTEPYHSGIGGGGFWLIHLAKENKDLFIDAREVAPLLASRTMYQDEQGKVNKGASLFGAIAAAIPGVPAALDHLSSRYGKLSLKTTLEPAIRYAKEGFAIDDRFVSFLKIASVLKNIKNTPSSNAIFLDKGKLPKAGFILKQTELAKTLEVFAKKGKNGFYHGEVAKELVSSVQEAKGIWQLKDLHDYKIKVREPLVDEINGVKIVTAPLPSAGGMALLTILELLKEYSLPLMDRVTSAHYVIEAMRLAYWDRANYMGDPDFVSVPIEMLRSKIHIKELKEYIKPNKATPSNQLKKQTSFYAANHYNTTHFSIIDQEGNMVSATLTINYIFGSGFVAGKTGVLLNDEMDDFSTKVEEKNIFGLVGSDANSIEPKKRPLSSMSPTFLFSKEMVGVLGTPGGSRIPTMVTLAALAFMDGKGPITWVGQPRFHHQYLPDLVEFENDAFDAHEQDELQKMGYKLKRIVKTYAGKVPTYGDMQAVLWDKKDNFLQAVSDFRRGGAALVKQ